MNTTDEGGLLERLFLRCVAALLPTRFLAAMYEQHSKGAASRVTESGSPVREQPGR